LFLFWHLYLYSETIGFTRNNLHPSKINPSDRALLGSTSKSRCVIAGVTGDLQTAVPRLGQGMSFCGKTPE